MALHRSPRNGAAQAGRQASFLPLYADGFIPPAERDTQGTPGNLGGFRATERQRTAAGDSVGRRVQV